MTAAQTIGAIAPGCEIFGLTEGRFSLIDILEHCIEATGPVVLDAMLWTYYTKHLDRIRALMDAGQVLRTRWLVDDCTPRRDHKKRAQFDHLVRIAGAPNVRCTSIHAKIITLSNERWSLVIRTSANLNRNPRSENFEISDDPAMLALVTALMDEAMDHPLTDPAVTLADRGTEVAEETSQTLMGRIDFPRKPPSTNRSKLIKYA